jgi:GT2 family glycosyltransferase
MPRASIIVISYNSFKDTTRLCVESLYACRCRVPFETVIVDNGSDAATVAGLQSLEGRFAGLTVIYNGFNAGFAGGNNIGLRRGEADYYVLLNNDTVVTDDWLDKMVGFLETHEEVGLAGPVTNYAGSEQRLHVDSGEEAGIIREGLEWTRMCRGDFFFTEMISFFCVVLRKRVFNAVGLLDESFGLGMFEDTDYCLRVLQHHFKIAALEDVFVYHQGSRSFNKIPDLNVLFQENLQRYEAKHRVAWRPEHNGYLRLIGHYLSQGDGSRAAQEKLRYKIANRVRMLEQLDCSGLFRNYVALQARMTAMETVVPAQPPVVAGTSDSGPPRKPLDYLRRSPLGRLARGLDRQAFPRYARQALEIYRQEGLWELKRGIVRKIRPPQPVRVGNPYRLLSLLKPIDIQVIERDYESPSSYTPFSLVTTVRNEGDNIRAFLASLEAQLLRPDEIVIVDGGSTDDTVDHIESFMGGTSLKVQLIVAENLNIAQGRNRAVTTATHDLIVLTDAGCEVDRRFCRNLIGPLLEDPGVDLVGGIYHALEDSPFSRELVPDWSNDDPAWWQMFLPSARSQAIRKPLFFQCGGFPEFLTLTGEDTLFDINYRRVSRRWIYNKKAFVHWKAPTTQEQSLRLWNSYGRGNGESGIGDFDFYDHLVAYRETGTLQNDTPMGAFFHGYTLGREKRSAVEIKRRKIRGLLLVLTDTPIGQIEAYRPLLKKYLDQNYKVVLVYSQHTDQAAPFLDIDFSLLELYWSGHFDTDEFIDRYRDILDAVVIRNDTLDAALRYAGHKIATLQKMGYHRLNSEAHILATVFRDFPLRDGNKSQEDQERQVIEHYRRWFPVEKHQGTFFAKLILEHMPEWLHQEICRRHLSLLDFGCSCGHLVHLLATKYKKSRVSGIDIKQVRINKAHEYYPFDVFQCRDIRQMPDLYDCIFTSNVLEHFQNPLQTISELLCEHLGRHLIILVPYNETDRIEGHYYTFTDDSFPELFQGLRRLFSTIIPCNNIHWPGNQILVVYSRQDS